MTQHTPGPWQMGGELISKEGSNLEIASVWSESANRKLSPRQSEADANARLIAAAPELLEVLLTLLVAVDHKRYNVRADLDFFLADAAARTVIAKATG